MSEFKNLKIVFFDSTCLICNKAVRTLLSFDKEKTLHFAPVNGRVYKDLCIENKIGDIDSIIYSNQDRLSYKSQAILNLCNDLKIIPSLLLKIIGLFPKSLTDLIYDIIAKNRYRFFRPIDECSLIPKQDRDRLLD